MGTREPKHTNEYQHTRRRSLIFSTNIKITDTVTERVVTMTWFQIGPGFDFIGIIK